MASRVVRTDAAMVVVRVRARRAAAQWFGRLCGCVGGGWQLGRFLRDGCAQEARAACFSRATNTEPARAHADARFERRQLQPPGASMGPRGHRRVRRGRQPRCDTTGAAAPVLPCSGVLSGACRVPIACVLPL